LIIPVLICVISFALLLQFFVSYCRSVIAAGKKSELSEQVREIAGISDDKLPESEFSRLVQLLRLCPGSGDDGGEIRADGRANQSADHQLRENQRVVVTRAHLDRASGQREH